MGRIWIWELGRAVGEIWVRIAIYGLVAVFTAMIAMFAAPVVPAFAEGIVDSDAVEALLEILSSSMLAVTTFSVSIMISAHVSAASGASPRVTALMKRDTTSQQVLATFVGAFVFALVSLIGLKVSAYGPGGRLVLFLVTVGVLAMVVVQLVRWIGHLNDYGRASDTHDRVEDAAREALKARLADPYLGCHPLDESFARAIAAGTDVCAKRIGYLQIIDIERLSAAAERADVTLAVRALPGSFVHPGLPLVTVLSPGRADVALDADLRKAFAIERTRSFEQDPRFGILTLTEIASRALSPAVNDPGTAIDVLGRHLRVLSHWSHRNSPEVRYRRLLVPGVALEDVMLDAFGPIARDGAASIEVQIRLLKMLIALTEQAPSVFGPHALKVGRRAVAFSLDAMPLAEDRETIVRLADTLENLVVAVGKEHLSEA